MTGTETHATNPPVGKAHTMNTTTEIDLTEYHGTPLRGSAVIGTGDRMWSWDVAVIPGRMRRAGYIDRDANVTVNRPWTARRMTVTWVVSA